MKSEFHIIFITTNEKFSIKVVYESSLLFGYTASKEEKRDIYTTRCNRITLSTVEITTFRRYDDPFFDRAQGLPLRAASE